MGKVSITDSFFYRWRYQLSFMTIGALLFIAIILVTFVSPGGISKAEMNSVVASTYTNPKTLLGESPENIIHLPYRLLQKFSLAALDVNLLSIKLPSILMSIGSVLALYGLLRLWFRRNVAVISSVIVMVSGQFLLLTQLGTPAIGYIFWNAALLYSISMLARSKRSQWVWFMIATTIAALSIYSPLEIYAVLALLATCLIHPHARFIVFKQLPRPLLAASVVLFAVLITPLIASLIQKPELGLTLLGVPKDFASVMTMQHMKDQIMLYAGFYNTSTDTIIAPAYGLGVIALAGVGLYRMFTAKYTAKSYIITIWIALLIPSIVVNAESAMVIFIPTLLLVAFGVDYLIRSWYRLFPNNPYARIFGLLPLGVLVVGLLISGAERFMYGYHYDPAASKAYTNDLSLVNNAVDANVGKSIVIIVPEEEREFYNVYAERKGAMPKIVSTSDSKKQADVQIVHRLKNDEMVTAPNRILTSASSADSDRFYLYKK